MNDEPKSQTKLGQAIAGQLHVPWAIDRPCRAKWCYPVSTDGTTVVVRDSDCGLARPVMHLSMEEWEHCASGGLWRLVGIFSFVMADDPAADDIAACHRSPDAMGRKLHDLRDQLKTAEADGAKAALEKADAFIRHNSVEAYEEWKAAGCPGLWGEYLANEVAYDAATTPKEPKS